MTVPLDRPPARAAGPDLLVLQKWEESAGWLLAHTDRPPKPLLSEVEGSARFTLAQRVQNHALDVVEMLTEARYEPGARARLLKEANLRFERMRLLLRIARGAGIGTAQGFEGALRRIDEAGRMVHGWRQTVAARRGASFDSARASGPRGDGECPAAALLRPEPDDPAHGGRGVLSDVAEALVLGDEDSLLGSACSRNTIVGSAAEALIRDGLHVPEAAGGERGSEARDQVLVELELQRPPRLARSEAKSSATEMSSGSSCGQSASTSLEEYPAASVPRTEETRIRVFLKRGSPWQMDGVDAIRVRQLTGCRSGSGISNLPGLRRGTASSYHVRPAATDGRPPLFSPACDSARAFESARDEREGQA